MTNSIESQSDRKTDMLLLSLGALFIVLAAACVLYSLSHPPPPAAAAPAPASTPEPTPTPTPPPPTATQSPIPTKPPAPTESPLPTPKPPEITEPPTAKISSSGVSFDIIATAFEDSKVKTYFYKLDSGEPVPQDKGKIKLTGLKEGHHTVVFWVEDSRGIKSATDGPAVEFDWKKAKK